MATFEHNNGATVELKIDSKYNVTKLFITVIIKAETTSIKFAGRSRINCLFRETKDVIFTDYALAYANELFNKDLSVKVDATKFKVTDEDIDVSKTPITCELIIEAGDDLLEKYILSDVENPSVNSIFIFKVKFQKK